MDDDASRSWADPADRGSLRHSLHRAYSHQGLIAAFTPERRTRDRRCGSSHWSLAQGWYCPDLEPGSPPGGEPDAYRRRLSAGRALLADERSPSRLVITAASRPGPRCSARVRRREASTISAVEARACRRPRCGRDCRGLRQARVWRYEVEREFMALASRRLLARVRRSDTARVRPTHGEIEAHQSETVVRHRVHWPVSRETDVELKRARLGGRSTRRPTTSWF